MKGKVDKGFELVYWNLSYRRKFIRTILQIPLIFLLFGFLGLVGFNLYRFKMVFILLSIVTIGQIIYNYIKWKNDEQS